MTTGRKITMAEVERHASKDSAWFVRDGKVRQEKHLRTHSLASNTQARVRNARVSETQAQAPAGATTSSGVECRALLSRYRPKVMLRDMLCVLCPKIVRLRPQVYDGTPFMKDHPGGADSIIIVAGQARHSPALGKCSVTVAATQLVSPPVGSACCTGTWDDSS